MSNETIKPPRPNTVLAPELNYIGNKTRVEFNGTCLTQNKIIFHHKKIVSIYIAFEFILYNSSSNYPTLENCLFGAFKLTRGTGLVIINILGMELDLTGKDFFTP